ncbi:hypothetical protein M422DRAFT_784004 [Sphaerobolus stellatus SS14]|uniref:Uncharacterized protein n=1 Tax=Sphaerobolus stellatus (strain SS14) TaxID=990650 RepID=A0A0C9UNE3_SPHS4|nr:hypothetical protein M422DRAFT_784004 [Sphaerobolus stellatus SS14]
MFGPDTPKLMRKILKKYGPPLPSVLAPEIASHVNFVGRLDSTETESAMGSGLVGFGMRWSVGREAAVAVAVLGQRGSGGRGTFRAGGSGIYPSRDDFERNFNNLPDAESSNDDGGAYLSDEYENSDDNLDYAADQGEDDGEGEEGPLPPGSTSRCSISSPTGQRRWLGEKGGVGAEEYALVPESYLEFVRGDEEDGDDEEGDE